jgi:hypothetical protein
VPGRWGPEGPPPEAYSRVTDAARFRPLVVAADELVAGLQDTYDVTVAPVDVSADMPDAVRAQRIVPRAGASIVVEVTSFPGVRLRLGHWTMRVFPDCGCDACDESAQDAIDLLTETVDVVVTGRFSERLRRWRPSLSTDLDRTRSWSLLGRDEYRQLARIARPRNRLWPAWPLRGPRLIP